MAKPVHKDSNYYSSSSLDLSLLPPTQSSFQKGKSIDYHPITSLSNGEPIEFLEVDRNLSISHEHIFISMLKYQKQMVLI